MKAPGDKQQQVNRQDVIGSQIESPNVYKSGFATVHIPEITGFASSQRQLLLRAGSTGNLPTQFRGIGSLATQVRQNIADAKAFETVYQRSRSTDFWKAGGVKNAGRNTVTSFVGSEARDFTKRFTQYEGDVERARARAQSSFRVSGQPLMAGGTKTILGG